MMMHIARTALETLQYLNDCLVNDPGRDTPGNVDTAWELSHLLEAGEVITAEDWNKNRKAAIFMVCEGLPETYSCADKWNMPREFIDSIHDETWDLQHPEWKKTGKL